MAAVKIDGGCNCGSITFEAEIDPAGVGVCHCTDCQQLTGTAFTTFVFAPRAGFKLLSGTPKVYLKTGSSGAKRAQAFCPECGSRIYASAAVAEPERYNLRLGTIRQRRELRPQKQIWCRSALDWVMDLGSVKQFPREP
jgi:hypothetical protein